ncbi:MAG: zinc-dependent metalloprotease [Rhodoluna sp.]|nr:zinc-dependent metalloprotease [Rhodoluna sp.]MBP6186628.1 zinc-dependent metalloprotease [Rhodoluna sp.]
MSDNGNDSNFEGDGLDPQDFEAFMREFLEKGASGMDVEKLAAAAGLPNDPAQLAAMLAQLRSALNQSNPDGSAVNWKLASDQARQLAAANSVAVSDDIRKQLTDALAIANLWLNQATQISDLTQEPKMLSRELWVQDAMPLFQALSSPVAERMSVALSESLQANAPEELSGVLGNATSMMRSMGGALFAMQLGQSLGKLSTEVLTGGDIGLPIFAEQRAAFLTQNLESYINELDVETDQVLIYLAVRELAHARLFKQSKWLREHVINQITQYAAEIKIDTERIQEMTRDFDPNDTAALQQAFQSGAFIAARNDEQNRALESIENILALIEGWVDAISDQATALLPKSIAIGEAVRRRRASGGPAEKTFGTLIGLELRPRRLREAATLWREIGHRLGNEKRDALWDHPDLLPTAEEIVNPELLFARLAGDTDNFDKELRDLLGE